MKYNFKIILIFILIIIVISSVVLSIATKKSSIIIPSQTIENNQTVTETKEPIKICYNRTFKTDRDFYDQAWLKLNIQDNKITGEFNNYPAEKDSKVGSFEGTVGSVDPNLMARKAFVMWDSSGEGMNVKEELSFIFGEGNASIGFGGEQVNRGDGVYIYKNRDAILYNLHLDQIDCQTLDEKIFVEKYVTDNIVTIATNQPVLGGTWHVLAINVTPITKSGELTYEDGHIQAKAHFTYTYNFNTEAIAVDSFGVLK